MSSFVVFQSDSKKEIDQKVIGGNSSFDGLRGIEYKDKSMSSALNVHDHQTLSLSFPATNPFIAEECSSFSFSPFGHLQQPDKEIDREKMEPPKTVESLKTMESSKTMELSKTMEPSKTIEPSKTMTEISSCSQQLETLQQVERQAAIIECLISPKSIDNQPTGNDAVRGLTAKNSIALEEECCSSDPATASGENSSFLADISARSSSNQSTTTTTTARLDDVELRDNVVVVGNYCHASRYSTSEIYFYVPLVSTATFFACYFALSPVCLVLLVLLVSLISFCL